MQQIENYMYRGSEMIFSERSIALMRDGHKTQTTRLQEPHIKVGGIYSVKRNPYKKASFGKIKVIAKDQTTLSRFTRKDLEREGYENKKEFVAALERLNNRKISLRRAVWKIVFVYIPE